MSIAWLRLVVEGRRAPFVSCYSKSCREVSFHCIEKLFPFLLRDDLLSLIIFLKITVPEIFSVRAAETYSLTIGSPQLSSSLFYYGES